MEGAGLSMDRLIVEKAFRYSQENGVPLCAFLGDHTVTLKMTDELVVCCSSFCPSTTHIPRLCRRGNFVQGTCNCLLYIFFFL